MLAAATAIATATAILIVAGAGMSCDSGLPDYRGAKGFYRMGGNDIAMDVVDFHPERGADFLLSMGFITTMINEFRTQEPHEGYRVLKRMVQGKATSNSAEAQTPTPTPPHAAHHFVLTSNIDAYFLRTGFQEHNVYESHGSCNLLQCTKGGTWDDSCASGIWSWPDGDFPHVVGADLKITPGTASLLPRCQQCNSHARPHISHSTDYPEDIVPTRKERQEKALLAFLKNVAQEDLVVIEVGCGESIHSLRVETEIMVGKRSGGSVVGGAVGGAVGTTTLIRIDPGNANVPSGHIGVRMRAMDALVGIEERMKTL